MCISNAGDLEVILEPRNFDPGEHRFSLTVTDAFGQFETYILNFTSFELVVVCGATAQPGHTQITCSPSNNLTSFMCSFDGGPVEPCALDIEATPPQFAVGGHNVTFMATDIYGQMLTLFLEFPIIPGTSTCIFWVTLSQGNFGLRWIEDLVH